MKLIFLGTPAAAVPSLDAVIDAGHDVRLVVSRPDRPAGRSSRPRPPEVKRRAAERGIEVVQPRGVRRPAFAERLRAEHPDALVVVAFGRILPAPVLDVAPFGAINVHFSLLPAYRGAAPVQWALARGETRTGVTTMRLDEGMDEGDLLSQTAVQIAPDEHAPQLGRRLAEAGAALLVRTLDALAGDALTAEPQDPARATYAPLLTHEDGAVDPALTAREIEGRVRGFDPWPGVWLRRAERRLRLLEARAVPGATSAPPGEVLALEEDGLLLACGDGTRLAVARLQFEGRRALSARDAVNGRLLGPGDRLVRVEP